MNTLPRGPRHQAMYERWLAALRSVAPAEWDIGISGYDGIADYLNRIGWKSTTGKRIAPDMVRMWVWKRGFPIGWMNRRNKVFTTNILIQAWIASHREYQRERPKRAFRDPHQAGQSGQQG
jgi:hypothetical protein